MNLGIVLTARCNASCIHCSKSYGPNRTEELSVGHIVQMMEEAAVIEDGAELSFDLTGGEPFLNFSLLREVVAHGAHLGATVSCVTNGYWARDDVTTRERLANLHHAGLSFLGVSVSRFHQQFVPISRPRRALRIAAQLGIKTELKGAVTVSDLTPDGTLDSWKSTLDADKITIFPVLPRLRDGAILPESDFYREIGLPADKCPGEVLCIYADGIARSCCGPEVSGEFLAVGDTKVTPLREIHQRMRRQRKQQILREVGPIHFAKGAIAKGLGDRLRAAYAGPCDLCGHISRDSELRELANKMCAEADSAPARASGLKIT